MTIPETGSALLNGIRITTVTLRRAYTYAWNAKKGRLASSRRLFLLAILVAQLWWGCISGSVGSLHEILSYMHGHSDFPVCSVQSRLSHEFPAGSKISGLTAHRRSTFG